MAETCSFRFEIRSEAEVVELVMGIVILRWSVWSVWCC